MIAALRPDVLTLDVHMPVMDGVEFLRQLMPTSPMPVVMVTALSIEDGHEVLTALELGAVDYIQKPRLSDLGAAAGLICDKVRSASYAKVVSRRTSARPTLRRPTAGSHHLDTGGLIAIGASTGGTEAIKDVLAGMPESMPAIVIVQHIPAVFSKAFAVRLNQLLPFAVKEAEDGDLLRPGLVLIAPGGKHLRVHRENRGWRAQITDEPAVNRHKPAVDVLFDSVAAAAGPRALGVLLTGMGADGAQGLLNMRLAGARTIAQDEASCVVFGMPKEAIKLGAAEAVCTLEDVAPTLVAWLGASPSVAKKIAGGRLTP